MYLLINLTTSTIIPKWRLWTNSLRSWGCFWWRGTAGSSSPWVRPALPANPTRSSGMRCTTRPSSAPTSRATATPTWATWTTFSRSWGLRGSPRRSVYPENEQRCFAGPTRGEKNLRTKEKEGENPEGRNVAKFVSASSTRQLWDIWGHCARTSWC